MANLAFRHPKSASRNPKSLSRRSKTASRTPKIDSRRPKGVVCGAKIVFHGPRSLIRRLQNEAVHQ